MAPFGHRDRAELAATPRKIIYPTNGKPFTYSSGAPKCPS